MDNRLKKARDHLAGTQRAVADAERMLRSEQARLANSGQLYPVESVELGHHVTRYEGDIAATFAHCTMGAVFRGKINRIPFRGGR